MEEINSATSDNRKPRTAQGGQRNTTVHSLQNAYRVNYANQTSGSVNPGRPQTQGKNDQAYSYVSMSPSQVMRTQFIRGKKHFVESPALKRIKLLQMSEKKSWRGIQTELTGRPGTSNIINKKRFFPVSEQQLSEEDRQKDLFAMLCKVKEIEDQKNGALSTQSQTQSNFFHSTTRTANQNARAYSDNLSFRPIQQNQLLHHPVAQSTYAGGRGYHADSCDLLYKLLKCDSKLVRSMLEANGFSHTESHDWNVLWMNSSGKSYLYEGLNEYQKINHFPSSYEVTRKDKLCYNIVKMQEKFGKHFFNIIPDTYVLPDEFADFYAHFHKLKNHDPKRNLWIVKPAALSRGRGIYIVDDISEINLDDTCVVSRYVSNPLLINGHKFDLRIYVLVTSFEPLRVYIYKEGLARFASEPYTNSLSKSNKYIHLTNYSVNKKNDNFVQNDNCEQDDYGFKWSLSALCKHLETIGIDMNLLWSRIYDVVMKSIISGEYSIMNAIKKNCVHRTNCFELFGYDILLDSDLKPWLVEVNLSPSLACESPLDMQIKSTLMADTFNLIGVKKFDRRKESMNKMKHRMKAGARGKSYNPQRYSNSSSFNAIKGNTLFTVTNTFQNSQQLGQDLYNHAPNSRVINEINKMLELNNAPDQEKDSMRKIASLKQKDILHETMSEYSRKGNFVRIYPAKGSDLYDCFFQQHRPMNKFIYKCLYSDELIPMIKINEVKVNYVVNFDGMPNYDNLKKKIIITEGKDNEIGSTSEIVKEDKEGEDQKSDEKKLQEENEKENNISGISLNQSTKVQKKDLSQSITPKKEGQSPINDSQIKGQLKERNISSAHPRNRGIDSDKASLASEALSSDPIQSNKGRSVKTSQSSRLTTMSNRDGSSTTGSISTHNNLNALNNHSDEKILITGDDVLIEYVERLINELKHVNEKELKPRCKEQMENFVSHRVWHCQDPKKIDPNSKYWNRLDSRLQEMKERRKRLVKSIYKKEGKLNEFEKGFTMACRQKQAIIKNFKATQLEEMLRTSTKNVAQEVVSCLVSSNHGGTLSNFGENLNFNKTTQGAAGFQTQSTRNNDESNQSLCNAETDEDSNRNQQVPNPQQPYLAKRPSNKKIVFQQEERHNSSSTLDKPSSQNNNFFTTTEDTPMNSTEAGGFVFHKVANPINKSSLGANTSSYKNLAEQSTASSSFPKQNSQTVTSVTNLSIPQQDIVASQYAPPQRQRPMTSTMHQSRKIRSNSRQTSGKGNSYAATGALGSYNSNIRVDLRNNSVTSNHGNRPPTASSNGVSIIGMNQQSQLSQKKRGMQGDNSMNALVDLLQNQGDISNSYIKKFMDVKTAHPHNGSGLQSGLIICGSGQQKQHQQLSGASPAGGGMSIMAGGRLQSAKVNNRNSLGMNSTKQNVQTKEVSSSNSGRPTVFQFIQ